MSEDAESCAILTIRYLNLMLMGSAHDWVAQNMPSEMPQGFLRSRSFHIAPDRGMTILWFDNQKNLDAAFPFLKSFQQEIAKRFEANCNAENGITSPELNAG